MNYRKKVGAILIIALFFGVAIFTNLAAAFSYSFAVDGSLQESSSSGSSTSPYWWVNSGGYMKLYGGRGHTSEENLPLNNLWRLLYLQSNPLDTDNGFHPQNIFRLVTKEKWQDIRQEVYFKITKDNLSPSPNRAEHNGLLLFNRYVDGNNLYYTGVRVDGAAVIKKKKNGVYTTLAYVPGIYPGTYNRDSNPNLLPKNKWIGLRSEVVNNNDGSVSIKLYIDKNWNNNWVKIAEVTDAQNTITSEGSGGIRTDFMDVTFDNFKANEI